mmetsp:Transcript_95757/g.169993  ORF Transcript_95757/g.169993 Transcript_95757/m.169993 type:complete len:88 (-) Transcript_95757:91-354(-)
MSASSVVVVHLWALLTYVTRLQPHTGPGSSIQYTVHADCDTTGVSDIDTEGDTGRLGYVVNISGVQRPLFCTCRITQAIISGFRSQS